jgi:hypothetical protein
MLQNDSICHKNASRVHKTSIVEHFFLNKEIPHVKKYSRSAPLNSKAVEKTAFILEVKNAR